MSELHWVFIPRYNRNIADVLGKAFWLGYYYRPIRVFNGILYVFYFSRHLNKASKSHYWQDVGVAVISFHLLFLLSDIFY